MSKELIEKLREDGKFLGGNFGKLMHEAADALETKAAPVGEREAAQGWYDRNDPEKVRPIMKIDWPFIHSLVINAFQAGAAHQRQQGDERGHDTKGSRKALGAMNAKLKAKIGRLERELATLKEQQARDRGFDKSSEVQRLREALHRIRDHAARVMDDEVFYEADFALTGSNGQQAREVVMPERKECEDGYPSDDWLCACAWNACLDEFARLNKGAGSHE